MRSRSAAEERSGADAAALRLNGRALCRARHRRGTLISHFQMTSAVTGLSAGVVSGALRSRLVSSRGALFCRLAPHPGAVRRAVDLSPVAVAAHVRLLSAARANVQAQSAKSRSHPSPVRRWTKSATRFMLSSIRVESQRTAPQLLLTWSVVGSSALSAFFLSLPALPLNAPCSGAARSCVFRRRVVAGYYWEQYGGVWRGTSEVLAAIAG